MQPVNVSTMSLINALNSGDGLQVASNLKQYKLPNGSTNYLEVLKIPINDRILGLITSLGYEVIFRNVVAAITVAMESLNISKPMSAPQIIELADAIMDTAGEDALSLEDLIIFLQKIVRGETGETYSRMDIPTFLKMFEKHRQHRYKALKDFEYEQSVYFKSLGLGRHGGELRNGEDAGSILDLMQTFYSGKD